MPHGVLKIRTLGAWRPISPLQTSCAPVASYYAPRTLVWREVSAAVCLVFVVRKWRC